jgi:hypothetical protein
MGAVSARAMATADAAGDGDAAATGVGDGPTAAAGCVGVAGVGFGCALLIDVAAIGWTDTQRFSQAIGTLV